MKYNEDYINQMLKEIDEAKKKKEDFENIMLLHGGKDLMDKVLEIIKTEGELDVDKERKDIDIELFMLLFDMMALYAKPCVYDKGNPFIHSYHVYRYKGELISLFRMTGQGSYNTFIPLDEWLLETIEEKNITDYDCFVETYFKNNEEAEKKRCLASKTPAEVVMMNGIKERVHYLKLVEPHFSGVLKGDKTFEVRVWDRDYQLGDLLILQLFDKEKGLQNEKITRRVTSLLSDAQYVQHDYVILSIQPLILDNTLLTNN